LLSLSGSLSARCSSSESSPASPHYAPEPPLVISFRGSPMLTCYDELHGLQSASSSSATSTPPPSPTKLRVPKPPPTLSKASVVVLATAPPDAADTPAASAAAVTANARQCAAPWSSFRSRTPHFRVQSATSRVQSGISRVQSAHLPRREFRDGVGAGSGAVVGVGAALQRPGTAMPLAAGKHGDVATEMPKSAVPEMPKSAQEMPKKSAQEIPSRLEEQRPAHLQQNGVEQATDNRQVFAKQAIVKHAVVTGRDGAAAAMRPLARGDEAGGAVAAKVWKKDVARSLDFGAAAPGGGLHRDPQAEMMRRMAVIQERERELGLI